MTAFLDRIAFWRREPQHGSVTTPKNLKPWEPQESHGYLADFGPNVPQETHGAAARKKSYVTFENGHMKLDVSGLLATPEGREQVRRACSSAPVKATPNVPVEDLGGTPVYYENNQPVYPGREKAP